MAPCEQNNFAHVLLLVVVGTLKTIFKNCNKFDILPYDTENYRDIWIFALTVVQVSSIVDKTFIATTENLVAIRSCADVMNFVKCPYASWYRSSTVSIIGNSAAKFNFQNQ